jgi:hypothetical protein
MDFNLDTSKASGIKHCARPYLLEVFDALWLPEKEAKYRAMLR